MDPGVLCISLVVISVDNTIVNVALPTIVRDLGAGARGCSGSSTPTPSCSPPAAHRRSLGDRSGARGPDRRPRRSSRAFSALASFATSPAMLIAARALMGIGAALHLPGHAVDPHQHVHRAASGPGPSASGPACRASASCRPDDRRLAGRALRWGSVFLVNVPICIAGHRRRALLRAATRATPRRAARPPRRCSPSCA